MDTAVWPAGILTFCGNSENFGVGISHFKQQQRAEMGIFSTLAAT